MSGGGFTHDPRKQSRAFSLIEVLAVVAIIALLLSILLPSLRAARRQAERLQCAGNLRDFGNACVLYKTENNHYPRAEKEGAGLRVGTLANIGGVAKELVKTKLVADPRTLFCPISLKRDRHSIPPFMVVKGAGFVEEFWKTGQISYLYLVGVRDPYALPDGTPTFNAARESPDYESNDSAVLAGDRTLDLRSMKNVTGSNHGREGGWFYFVGGDLQWREWPTLTGHPVINRMTWYWPRTAPALTSPTASTP